MSSENPLRVSLDGGDTSTVKAIASIRRARPSEAGAISELAMRSKAHWGYSSEFMEACRDELTVSEEDLQAGHVRYFVAEREATLIGYYGVEPCGDKDYELEALFVDPLHIGAGVGKALMDHALCLVKSWDGRALTVQSDPHAAGFYRAAGARSAGVRSSTSVAGRELPLFIFTV